ncbi:MAG TPA: hypothetical protein VNH22_07990 [Blastocatellia bacterium]|nr:hypothetical protein [Blastocatellia bacterium]
MQIFRMLFPLKCEECGQIIRGEKFPGPGPGSICEACYNRIQAERRRRDEESSRIISQKVMDRVKKDFLPGDVDEVLRILTDYGKDRGEQGDKEFMRLAILRLANGDKEKLPGLVKVAKMDFRDILAPIQREYGQDWLERFTSE